MKEQEQQVIDSTKATNKAEEQTTNSHDFAKTEASLKVKEGEHYGKVKNSNVLIARFPALQFLWISLLVIVLDQLTKYWTVTNIEYATRGIEVLPFFNLVHVYNFGAAFSMFADLGGVQRYFLSAIAIIMSLVFIVVLARTNKAHRYTCLAYTLFIGGAIGNLIDRLWHGYVIDFLLFYWQDQTGTIVWAYPAFNVADIAVCVGAFLLVVVSFAPDKSKNKSEIKIKSNRI